MWHNYVIRQGLSGRCNGAQAVFMFGGLQMLRGVAATLVVLFHLQAAAVTKGFSPGIFQWFVGGEVGVDVFFVLSGFVIFHAARAKPNLGATAFLRQRFWRIVPPYWATLALTLIALAAIGVMFDDWSSWPGVWNLWVSVFLLPLPGHVVFVAWTLSIEGLFYLLFAATFFRFGTRGAIYALAIWAAVTQLMRFSPVPISPTLGGFFLVVEFLYGALIALAWSAGWRRGGVLSFAFGLVGLAAVVSGVIPLHWGREWVAGFPAAAVVYGMLVCNWKVPNWAMIWGEASYLLYLLHILVFSITGTLLSMVGVAPYGSDLAMLALGGLAVGVSVVATLWVERPYRRWTQSRRSGEGRVVLARPEH